MDKDVLVALIAAAGIFVATLPAFVLGVMSLRQSRSNGRGIGEGVAHVATGNGRSIARYVMDLDTKVDTLDTKIDAVKVYASDHDRRDRAAFALLGIQMEDPPE
jgi:hypothetical protein